MKTTVDCVIIGAGAAGMMCAATAGYAGASVLVVDHAPKAGAKIRISGGGKANFTNLNVTPEHYICRNPHFVKSALSRYRNQDFIELVERHGMAYEVREGGKLFCKEQASDLIQVLRTECDWAGVAFSLKTKVLSVTQQESGFALQCLTAEGERQILAKQLVVATGGLSFPKLKATGLGYELAKQFGLSVLPTRPGLVPLILQGHWAAQCEQLAGVSLAVRMTVADRAFEEAMLFTHHGISGPAVLQASNYWQKGEAITINLLPQFSTEALEQALLDLKQQNGRLATWLGQFWPKRFVKAWLDFAPLIEGQTVPKMAEVKNETLQAYAHRLQSWSLFPKETAGYDKAEVTLGGVDTDECSSQTMEAKKVSGLYFIGEVLDVTGHLGGHNFQWAWSSGVAAGLAVGQKLSF